MGSLMLPELCRCAVCGEEREMVEQTGFCRQCWETLPHNPEARRDESIVDYGFSLFV